MSDYKATCHCGAVELKVSFPDMFGVNVGCIEGVDMDGLGEILVNDGINHPMDQKS